MSNDRSTTCLGLCAGLAASLACITSASAQTLWAQAVPMPVYGWDYEGNVVGAVAGGYLCLTLSGFKVHVLLGVLVALTMVTSSIATVAFLPAVVLRNLSVAPGNEAEMLVDAASAANLVTFTTFDEAAAAIAATARFARAAR